MKLNSRILILFSIVALFSCKNNEKEDEVNPQTDFNETAMFTKYADEYIIPGYQDFKLNADSLHESVLSLTNNPTQQHLQIAQNQLKATYLSWSRVYLYDFGPADDALAYLEVGTFPCDTALINTNISTGNTSLSSASQIAAKGLSALDYILFNYNAYNRFAESDNNFNTYVIELTSRVKNLANQVNNSWTSYRSEFITNTGNANGSSLSLFVNAFSHGYEKIKNDKVGIPTGTRTLGIPNPLLCEAYYSGYSLEIAIEATENILTIYNAGLSDYLVHLEENELDTDIQNQVNSGIGALRLLPPPFSNAVIDNNTECMNAYTELQKGTALIKVELSFALGVDITYNSGDGD